MIYLFKGRHKIKKMTKGLPKNKAKITKEQGEEMEMMTPCIVLKDMLSCRRHTMLFTIEAGDSEKLDHA